MEDLISKEMKKTELPNYFSAFIFNGKYSTHAVCVTGHKVRDWENEESPTVREEWVRDHLRNIKVHKTMRPDEVHLWILKKQTDEVAKLISVIFENFCSLNFENF